MQLACTFHLSPENKKFIPGKGHSSAPSGKTCELRDSLFSHQTRNRMDLQRLKRAAKALSKQYVLNQKEFIRDQSYRIENFRVENQFMAAWDLINCIGNRKNKKKCNISGDTPEDRIQKWHAHFSLLFGSPDSENPNQMPQNSLKIPMKSSI